MIFKDDHYFMEKALLQAHIAYKKGEVPVGAVVVKDGQIIARGHNLRESTNDPCAHAELLAMKKASKKSNSWRLSGCTLYVTLEPCPMCTGAILNSRVSEVVFGAYDAEMGCCGSRTDLTDGLLSRSVRCVGGIMEEECAKILSEAFRRSR